MGGCITGFPATLTHGVVFDCSEVLYYRVGKVCMETSVPLDGPRTDRTARQRFFTNIHQAQQVSHKVSM